MDASPPASLRTVACNLCESDERTTICVENSFPICRCERCGLIYVTPQPLAGSQFWRDAGVTEDSSFEPTKRPVFEAGLSALHRLRPQGGRILDVGCGFGGFLELAGQAGWEPNGLDLSDVAVTYARERKGLINVNVNTGDLAGARYPDGHFDAVTLWNVLDHVPDPLGTLREVHRVLGPGGILVMRLPNMVFHDAVKKARRVLPSRGSRRPARYLAGMAPPRRLFGFTPRTLRLMVTKAGFRIVELGPARHYKRGMAPLVTAVELISRAAYLATARSAVVSPTFVAFAEKVR